MDFKSVGETKEYSRLKRRERLAIAAFGSPATVNDRCGADSLLGVYLTESNLIKNLIKSDF